MQSDAENDERRWLEVRQDKEGMKIEKRKKIRVLK